MIVDFEVKNARAILNPGFSIISPYLEWDVAELHLVYHLDLRLLWRVFVHRDCLDVSVYYRAAENDIEFTVEA